MPDYYSETADVRERAHNILAVDFPDAEIQIYQKAFKQLIDLKTHSTWDSTDPEYPLIQMIEEILAAAQVKLHYDPEGMGAEAEANTKFATDLLQGVIDESTSLDIDEAALEISRTEFQTYPKNPSVRIPRGRLTQVGYNPATYNGPVSSKYDLD